MNLPFLRFFKRDKGAHPGAVAVAPPPVVPIDKPASDRFGKTVRPNSSRIVALEPSPTVPVPSAPAAAVPRRISLGENGLVAAAIVAPHLAGPSASGAERTIALQLVDLVPHIPGGMLTPAQIDPNHRVLLKAADLERGMSSGHPTVLLRAIYQQAPEFFSGEVKAEDQTEVSLPFGKVLEQFAAFQVRPDQVCEPAVPEVETPFLKATLEDSKRFGTTVEPLPKPSVAEIPLPPIEIAPAAPVAAPAPEIKTIKAIKPIRLTLPTEEKPAGSAASATVPVEPPPARLPSVTRISPNGTGVPASERVPASSGSPVPTPLSSPLASPPARIPFKVTPPSNDLRAPIPAKLPPAKLPPVDEVEVPSTSPRVRLPLRSVLRGIPPFQISGPIEEVPETAQIEFAFAIVEPQLSLGKIAVSPAQFLAALPEEFRSRFQLEDAETPVALPLQEVLQNLPNESLQVRGDQEEAEVAEFFETPFSKKAAEDAARFKTAAAPIAKTDPPAQDPVGAGGVDLARVVEAAAPMPAQEISVKSASTPSGSPIPATAAPRPDPKAIVSAASELPGVSACAVVFSDGLSLAGNIPAESGVEALCAMAPSMMKRLGDQMAGATLGSLEGLTIFGAKTPISFFAQGNICLAALHSAGELTSSTRLRLNTTAQELARIYAQPTPPNA